MIDEKSPTESPPQPRWLRLISFGLKKTWRPLLLRTLRLLVLFVLVCGCLLLAIQLLLPWVINIDQRRDEITTYLEELTGRKISIGRLDLDIRRGVAIEFRDVIIYEENGNDYFLRSDRIFFVIDVLPLLKKEIVIDKIVLQNPEFVLRRFADGSLNLQKLIAQTATNFNAGALQVTPHGNKLKSLAHLHLLVYEGKGQWSDESKGIKPATLGVDHLNLIVPQLTFGGNTPFRLSFEVPAKALSSYFEVRGKVLNFSPNLDLTSTMIDAEIRMRAGQMNLLLPYYRRFLPYKDLTGHFSMKANYLGNLKGEFNTHGSLLFDHIRLDYPHLFKAPIVAEHGSLTFALALKPGRLDLERAEIHIEDMDLNGHGYIEHLENPATRELHFDFSSKRIPVKIGQQFIPVKQIPKDDPEFEQFFQHDMLDGTVVNMEAHMRGKTIDWSPQGFKNNLDLFSFRADVDHIRVDVNHPAPHSKHLEPLIFTRGSVALDRGTLSFINMRAQWAESALHEGYGSVTDVFSDKGILRLWLDADLQWRHAQGVLVYNLFDIFPVMDAADGKGLLKGRINLRIPTHHARDFGIDGDIQASNVSFQIANKPLAFSEINTTFQFKDQDIIVPKTNFLLGKSRMTAQGKFNDYYSPDIDAVVTSPAFDFDDLFGKEFMNRFRAPEVVPATTPGSRPLTDDKTAKTAPPEESILDRWNIHVAVDLNTGNFRRLPFTEFQTDISLDDSQLNFEALSMSACGGLLHANDFYIDFHPETTGDFYLNATYNNFEMACLLKALRRKEIKANVTGKAKAGGYLSGNLGDRESLLGQLNGKAGFEMKQGTLIDLKTLANVMQILNLHFLEPRLKNFPFVWAKANFNIEDGLAQTENLFIKGKLGSISGVGSFYLPDLTIDAYMGIHLYEKMDKFLGYIPIIGTVIGGSDGKVVTFYFQVKGDVHDPKVNLTPFYALRTGISKTFKGFLKYFQ